MEVSIYLLSFALLSTFIDSLCKAYLMLHIGSSRTRVTTDADRASREADDDYVARRLKDILERFQQDPTEERHTECS